MYCSLQMLDLGSCCHESPDFNRICTERIVNNVGHSIDDLSLNTAITGDAIELTKPESPLKKLRKIQLTPLFPVENVVDTLPTLSDSPVEQLSVRCMLEDIEDICSALEDFLSSRIERGETALHKHLKDIIVDPVEKLEDAFTLAKQSGFITLSEEQAEAVKRVQDYLQDLRLAGDAQALESCSEMLKGTGGKQVAGLLAASI